MCLQGWDSIYLEPMQADGFLQEELQAQEEARKRKENDDKKSRDAALVAHVQKGGTMDSCCSEPVADEGVPVLPDIVKAVREVELSFHEAQVPSEPIFALMKSGTSRPGTAPRTRISVPTQDPQDRPEGWKES